MKKSIFFNVKMIKKFLCLLSIIAVLFLGISYTFCYPTKINAYVAANVYSKPANNYFDDDNFYQCVVDNYNSKNNTDLSYTTSLSDSQLKSITSLSCSYKNIVSAKGIEKMTSLTYIDFQNNNLKSIDISGLSSLSSFNFNGNNQLIVANNTYSLNGKTYVRVGVMTEIKLNINFPSHFLIDDFEDPMNRTEFTKVDNNKFNVLLSVNNNNQIGIKVKNLNTEQLKSIWFDILGYTYDEFDDSLVMINKEQSNILNSVTIYPSDDEYLNNYTVKNLCNSENLTVSNGIIYSNNTSGDCQIKLIGPDSLYEIPLNIHLIKISSDLYEINNINRIYTGNHTKENEIMTNLNIDGADVEYKYNLANNDVLGLNIYYNEKKVREYVIKPISLKYKINNLFGSDKYIYTNNDTNEQIIQNISTYGQEEIVDNKLKISYGWYNNFLDIDEFKLIQINSDLYTFDDGYIYIGTDELNLNDINVTNGAAEVKDNKLLIKYNDTVLDEVKLISIDSEKYDLEKDYIYIGTDELNLNDISVTNGTAEVKDNKLLIKYNDTVLDEVKLISIDSEKYDLSKDYIYIGTDELDLNDISVVNGISEIKDNKLLIKYEDDVLGEFKLVSFNSKLKIIDKYIYVSNLNEEKILSQVTIINGNCYIENDKLKIKYNDIVLDEYSFIKITLNKLVLLNNNELYIASKTDEEIRKDFVVINAEAFIYEDKIEIIRENIVLDTFRLLTVNLGNLKETNKNIIVSKNVEYNEFINNITITDGLTYKLFDDDKEFTLGIIDKDLILKVYYNDKEIDSYNVTNEYLTIDESISVNSDNMYFNNIDFNTTVDMILNKIDTTAEVTVRNKDNEIITGNDLIGTGSVVSIKLSKETYEYTVIIHGDVDGDGVLKLSDIMKIANYTYKNKNSLSGVFELAADFDNNGTHNLQDIMKSAKALYGGK